MTIAAIDQQMVDTSDCVSPLTRKEIKLNKNKSQG